MAGALHRLAFWLVVVGWILIIGGIAAAIGLLISPPGTIVALLLALLEGPITWIGLGLALLALAELLRDRRG
ncbi:MAG TPA: hypothetical protein VIL08_05935 [Limnochorda sp.]